MLSSWLNHSQISSILGSLFSTILSVKLSHFKSQSIDHLQITYLLSTEPLCNLTTQNSDTLLWCWVFTIHNVIADKKWWVFLLGLCSMGVLKGHKELVDEYVTPGGLIVHTLRLCNWCTVHSLCIQLLCWQGLPEEANTFVRGVSIRWCHCTEGIWFESDLLLFKTLFVFHECCGHSLLIYAWR